MTNDAFSPSSVLSGHKAFGYLRVLSSLSTEIQIPLGVVRGTGPGPTLAVTAGLFAHEYCGVEAAARLYQAITPEQLSGTLLIVPVVDISCLQFRTPWLTLARSVNPHDGLVLNRLFPGEPPAIQKQLVAYRQQAIAAGDPTGSVSKHIAYKLFHDVVLTADYHVELRGGDLDESHLAHTVFLTMGTDTDPQSEEMAKVAGLNYVLPGTPEVGHTSKGTLIYETASRGIPSIIIESGLGYRVQPFEDSISRHVEGVSNLLKYFGMVEGIPSRPKHQHFLDSVWHWIPAPAEGFFHALNDQGDHVARDQIIGRVTAIDGSELATIASPIDGIVHCMFPRRVISRGDDVFTLLKVGPPTGFS